MCACRASTCDRCLKSAPIFPLTDRVWIPFPCPEAVFRYTTLLASVGRLEEAEQIIDTALRFDRENATLRSWANQVKSARQSQGPIQTQFINAQRRTLEALA